MEKANTDIAKIQGEINEQLKSPEVLNALVNTTFKGLDVQTMKRAMLEGMMRGFKFQDFLEKNIYAIPFKGSYSLVTSIDYARKVGQRSGVVGKSKPKYTDNEDGSIRSCEITIYKDKGHPDGYTAEVYFDEYFRGGGKYKNLWDTKPRTMIAKVAEMHALRMACPEELSQAYIEEDYEQEHHFSEVSPELKEKVEQAKTVEELKQIYEANKGIGKEFDKLVITKKKQLNENSPSATEDAGVVSA